MKLPTPDERRALLAARRHSKMARSPHAYVRGNTALFYRWLAEHGEQGVPQGPPIWICGDCHIGNLGPLASADGKIGVQIRDFDQAAIGNPAHDLIRLGLSLATAARGSSLPGVITASMLEHMIDGYALAIKPAARRARVAVTDEIDAVIRSATARSWKQLARERLVDTTPTIPLGRKFWPLDAAERSAIDALFTQADMQSLVCALNSREDDAPVTVLDAAYWVKGCSSLGLTRYAVLVAVGGAEHCLVDIKQAVRTVAPHARRHAMPRDDAKRVVEAARALSPALGDRMRAQPLLGRAVFARELMPQDLKLDIDRLSVGDAARTARYLAFIVGQAHARQLDAPARAAWHKDIARGRSKSRHAPDWLWRSVVKLVADHEAGYLDHCRRVASR